MFSGWNGEDDGEVVVGCTAGSPGAVMGCCDIGLAFARLLLLLRFFDLAIGIAWGLKKGRKRVYNEEQAFTEKERSEKREKKIAKWRWSYYYNTCRPKISSAYVQRQMCGRFFMCKVWGSCTQLTPCPHYHILLFIMTHLIISSAITSVCNLMTKGPSAHAPPTWYKWPHISIVISPWW